MSRLVIETPEWMEKKKLSSREEKKKGPGLDDDLTELIDALRGRVSRAHSAPHRDDHTDEFSASGLTLERSERAPRARGTPHCDELPDECGVDGLTLTRPNDANCTTAPVKRPHRDKENQDGIVHKKRKVGEYTEQCLEVMGSTKQSL